MDNLGDNVYKLNGITITPGREFIDLDGNRHPNNWQDCYTSNDLTRLGITVEEDVIIEETPQDLILQQIAIIDIELIHLDNLLPRCIEDVLEVCNINDESLPSIMLTRLLRKRELRANRNTLTEE